MTGLSDDPFQSELESFGHSQTFDPITPLPCDRWLALSALQKSIRRGDGLTAQRALGAPISTIRARRGGGC
jgi:hypothetical protein